MATNDSALYKAAMAAPKGPEFSADVEDRRHENDGSPRAFIDVNKAEKPTGLPAHAHKKASYRLTQ